MSKIRRFFFLLLAVAVSYVLAAYFILPLFWQHYEHHPQLSELPKVSLTKEKIPGDPVNIGIVGTESEVIHAFLSAGWRPADPVTLRSGLHIAESVLLNRPYTSAPMSNLYLWDRRQDLAFEKLAGKSPRHRHHVRFWRSPILVEREKSLWVGCATFDRSVGFSHRTGKITHHIAPDIDEEREIILRDFENSGQLVKVYEVTGVGPALNGRNGNGDWYFTDGELAIGILTEKNAVAVQAPSKLSNPPAIEFKNQLWRSLRSFLKTAVPSE